MAVRGESAFANLDARREHAVAAIAGAHRGLRVHIEAARVVALRRALVIEAEVLAARLRGNFVAVTRLVAATEAVAAALDDADVLIANAVVGAVDAAVVAAVQSLASGELFLLDARVVGDVAFEVVGARPPVAADLSAGIQASARENPDENNNPGNQPTHRAAQYRFAPGETPS